MTTTEIRALETELRAEHDSSEWLGESYCWTCRVLEPCHAIRAADALALLVAVAEDAGLSAALMLEAELYQGSDGAPMKQLAWPRVRTSLAHALAALAEAKL